MLTPLSARYLDLPQQSRLPSRTRGGARQPRSRARACPFSHAAESLPFAAAECGTTTAGRYEICRRLVQTSLVVLVEIAAPEYISMNAFFIAAAGVCIQLYFLPYAEDDDDTLEVAFQLNLFLSLFGVVMQESLGYDLEGSWQEKLLMPCPCPTVQ